MKRARTKPFFPAAAPELGDVVSNSQGWYGWERILYQRLKWVEELQGPSLLMPRQGCSMDADSRRVRRRGAPGMGSAPSGVSLSLPYWLTRLMLEGRLSFTPSFVLDSTDPCNPIQQQLAP